MSRLLRDWIIEIKKEFGIYIQLIPIDPSDLFADKTELEYMTKVAAFAEWAFHNDQGRIPLAVFEGEKITRLEDLQQVLQAG